MACLRRGVVQVAAMATHGNQPVKVIASTSEVLYD